MIPIGQKVYLLRTKKAITQTELSARSGVTQANLSKIERGELDPTVSTLLKICYGLDLRPAELFEDGPPSAPVALTRPSVEKMARAVFDPSLKLSQGERETAELMRKLVPGLLKRRLSARKIYRAWYELRQRLSREAIHTLTERIEDERLRETARAEREYQRLVSNLRRVLGRGR